MNKETVTKINKLVEEMEDTYDILDRMGYGGLSPNDILHPQFGNTPRELYGSMSDSFGIGSDVNGPAETRAALGWGLDGGAPYGGPTAVAAYYRDPTPENKELMVDAGYEDSLKQYPADKVQDVIFNNYKPTAGTTEGITDEQGSKNIKAFVDRMSKNMPISGTVDTSGFDKLPLIAAGTGVAASGLAAYNLTNKKKK